MNEIYIDAGFSETRVAVMEDGNLAEVYIERQGSERIAGNIYKGKVSNVLPGMQAAFVDIGIEKNAFLFIKDAIRYNMRAEEKGNVSIAEILKPGEEILVQISKEPAGTKGARVTTHITLPGRYIVLMPNVDYIGISRRIEDEEERSRLKSIMEDIKPEGMGVIIRTEAEGKNTGDFIEDINFLTGLWSKVCAEQAKVSAPEIIHRDMDIIYRSIRDIFNRDTSRIIVNDRLVQKRAGDIVEFFSPESKNKVEYYGGSVNIFDFYGIEGKIEKALSNKIWLKSGGYIIIDQTEALTSIDVNTGRFTGSCSLKETVLLTNIEAAKEIAHQLRLRDIGGIIVIDFIDMDSEEHKQMVVEELKAELKKDRTKSSVLGITQLGLVEMTRKKMAKRLSSIMQEECPLCQGSGRVLNEESVVRKLEREIQRVFKETEAEAVLVEINEAIARYISAHGSDYITYAEEKCNKKVFVKGLYNMGFSEINIKSAGSIKKIDEASYPFEVGDRIEINAIKSKFLNASDRNNLFDGVIEGISYDENGKINKLTINL